MSATRIRFDPEEMVDAAARLCVLSGELKRAAAAARGVPLHGMPPDLAATARVVLSEAGCDLGAAGTTTDREAREIVGRAARALALDAGGEAEADLPPPVRRILERVNEAGRELLHDLRDPTPWDALGFANAFREKGTAELANMRQDLKLVRRKLKWAQKYWDEHPWVRRDFESPQDLRKNVAAIRKDVTGWQRTARRLERLDPETYVPKGLRGKPLVKVIPGAGDIYNFGVALGEGEAVPDAAAKAATQRAAAVGGAAVGAAACGTATAVTFGPGAATCPLLIGAGGAAGDYIAGKAYDPVVKPVLHKAADAGRKIYHFLGG
jgi:hypothetical protein